MSPDYVKSVLEPMHALYLEPTKGFADCVIDAGPLSREALLDLAADRLTRDL
jgi:uridine kinase